MQVTKTHLILPGIVNQNVIHQRHHGQYKQQVPTILRVLVVGGVGLCKYCFSKRGGSDK